MVGAEEDVAGIVNNRRPGKIGKDFGFRDEGTSDVCVLPFGSTGDIKSF